MSDTPTKSSIPRAAASSFPTGEADAANRACLNASERRAMLADIGQVALTLGQSLRSGQPDTGERHRSVPASPVPARAHALTSPQERLHFLGRLWAQMGGALADIARRPDSRAASVQRPVSLARSRGGPQSAALLARSPHSASAWQALRAAGEAARPSLASLSSLPSPAALSALLPPARPPCPDGAPLSDANSGGNENNANTTESNTIESKTEGGIGNSSENAALWDRARIAERTITRSQRAWANRMVVSLLRDIKREAQTLARLAAFCDDAEAGEQAAQIARETGRLLTGTFLRDCPPLRDDEHAAPYTADVIARCPPAYSVAYHGWRTLHHPLDFDWQNTPILSLPPLEAWQLYEIWCCLQIGAALLRAGWQVTPGNSGSAGAAEQDLLRWSPFGLRLNLATGRASRLRFHRPDDSDDKQKRGHRRGRHTDVLSLYYQPLFSSANRAGRRAAPPPSPSSPPKQAADGAAHGSDVSDVAPSNGSMDQRDEELALYFASRSHAMQPDIALHRRGRLTLLDPKYKRYARPEDAQDDINKMHAYTDAIVPTARGSRADSHERGVAAAWCLFPGTGRSELAGAFADADAAAPEQARALVDGESGMSVYAYPAASPEHPFGTAGVGAFLLRPGQPDTLPRLTAFLNALLRDA